MEKDTADDIEVCKVVVAETCNRFQKDTELGDEEEPLPLNVESWYFSGANVQFLWLRDEMQKART